MNQTIIDQTYRRLGLWVGYRRKKLLNQTKLARFRQENFILVNRLHPYFEYPSGHAVCSRTTLSNLENGGLLRESTLLPYFMRKLGVSSRFYESNWLSIQSFYERLDCALKDNEAFSAASWLSELETLSMLSYDNVLFQCEHPWVLAFLQWLDDPLCERSLDIDEYFMLYPILEPTLKNLLSDWLSFRILIEPGLWPKAIKYLGHMVDEADSGSLIIVIWHLFNGNVHDVFESKYFLSIGYKPESRFHILYIRYLTRLLKIKPTDLNIQPTSKDLSQEILEKTIEKIDALKKGNTKHIVSILSHEPYPHIFMKQWILDMAWHIKVTGQYKRFLKLFVELNSVNQGAE